MLPACPVPAPAAGLRCDRSSAKPRNAGPMKRAPQDAAGDAPKPRITPKIAVVGRAAVYVAEAAQVAHWGCRLD
jgi:hypothetical protein